MIFRIMAIKVNPLTGIHVKLSSVKEAHPVFPVKDDNGKYNPWLHDIS